MDFKQGQTVKCLKPMGTGGRLTKGQEYTIHEVVVTKNTGVVRLKFSPNGMLWRADRFQLIESFSGDSKASTLRLSDKPCKEHDFSRIEKGFRFDTVCCTKCTASRPFDVEKDVA